jgi:hypothetical protein
MAFVACLLSGATMGLAQQKEKQWKDRAEYDLYEEIRKSTDAAAQLKLLDTWKEKYPSTDYEVERVLMYTLAYQQAKQADKMYDSAEALVKLGPEVTGTDFHFRGLYFLTTLTTSTARTEPRFLDNGEKYARALMDVTKKLQKPANVSDADWQKQMKDLEILSHTTLGWVAMQRKNNAGAEKELRTLLQLNPENGQASYWLGTVILAQRDPAKQSEGMFHLARAGYYDGPGAMQPAGRQQVADYIKKTYTTFHGNDEAGFNELVAMARKSAVAPPDLRIRSKEEIEVEAENRMKSENPEGYLWEYGIKKRLLADDGEQYFASSMKNTSVALKGYVIGQDPPERPTSVFLAMSDRSTREVTLNLDEPFKYPAGRGTLLHFKGVPTSFTKEPFRVTFEVQQTEVQGWPPPPARQSR